MKLSKSQSVSQALFERARNVIPSGVNSPVRAFTQVGGSPVFIKEGDSAYVVDVDDNRYIDFIGSWGPIILGHKSEIQLNAIKKALTMGTSFGAPTELEVIFAELITKLIPGLEKVRLVSSGTEATMTAIRLARAYTNGTKILKFDGCYHGHADSFLVNAGSGLATQGLNTSPGVPEELASKTLSVEFNDIAAVRKAIMASGTDKLACIIVEPVAGNMGLVLPDPGFLSDLRSLCTEYGILLMFDEVMSGFRVGLKGASSLYNIIPDLFTYGKVIGGGLPMACFGGRSDIMDLLAPLGPVYQAGTLSGNPLAVSAGIDTIQHLIETDPYEELGDRTKYLVEGMRGIFKEVGIPFQANNIGSMFGFFFNENPVRNFTDAKKSDVAYFKKFFHEMLKEGVYFAPSAFEAGFIGVQHDMVLLAVVLEKIRGVVRGL
jgi:glutamate-1-semialdehyde 2,1-aminomutase